MCVVAQPNALVRLAASKVLANPDVQSKIQGTRAADEVQALGKFFQALNDDDGRACYSYAHVRAALDVAAVDVLLVCDDLLRTANFAQRKRFVALIEDAKAQGAAVYVLSRMHTSGEQLFQLSGVAAVLRYAINDFEEPDGQEEDEAALPPPVPSEDFDAVHWGEGWGGE